MVLFLPALLGAAGGLIGGIVSGKQSRKNVRAQAHHDRQLAEYAYGKDLEQWHRANEYNTPTAQMARLREAGLNPHLVYGSGSVAGNTAQATSPKYQSVKTDYSKRKAAFDPALMMSMLAQYTNFEGQAIRNDTLAAIRDQEKLKRDVMMGQLPKTVTGPSGKKKIVMNQYMRQLYETQLDIRKETLKQIRANTYKSTIGGDLLRIQRDFEEMLKTLGVAGKGVSIMRMLFNK